MIDSVLKKDLPQAYDLTGANVQLSSQPVFGRIALKDVEHCNNCNTKLNINCNEENMLIEIERSSVLLVDHESYIRQFARTQLGYGKNCDYLIVDDSGQDEKIAFCELSCSLEKSVALDNSRKYLPEGKRAKVMMQLEESARRFTAKAATKIFLSRFNQRHCIFGWRDPFVSEIPLDTNHHDTDTAMLLFGVATSGSESVLLQKKDLDGLSFDFYQVKYPSVYKW